MKYGWLGASHISIYSDLNHIRTKIYGGFYSRIYTYAVGVSLIYYSRNKTLFNKTREKALIFHDYLLHDVS